MQICQQTDNLLADKAFDADWGARLPYKFRSVGRNALLGQLVRGSRVIHLGCADHAPLIETKRAQGVWLHDVVVAEAQDACGVDNNADAIAIASTLGVRNLHMADVFGQDMRTIVENFKPDTLLLPDVLEHLQEPVSFLRRLASLAPLARLIVSVPNGLSLRNQFQVLRGIERVNSDHLSWYSPFTVLKLLRRGGYLADSIWASQISEPSTLAGCALSSLVKLRPYWADCLIVVARANGCPSAPQPQ